MPEPRDVEQVTVKSSTPFSYISNLLRQFFWAGTFPMKKLKRKALRSRTTIISTNALQYLTTVILPFVCTIMTAQVTYRTPELRQLSNSIPLQINKASEGYNHEVIGENNYVYHIENGTVDHVGISLFKDEIKSLAKTPILDFLERYFLQLSYPGGKTVEYILRSDRFRFLKGNVQTIRQLNDSDAFSYDYEMGLYHATWKRNGKTLLSVSFPKDYQLISGENKIEAEKLLEKDVENAANEEKKQMIIDRHQLVGSQQKGYYTLQGNSYQISKITNNLYFKGDSIKGFTLVQDISHPLESAANMMLSQYAEGNFTLDINQTLYGYNRKHFTVNLKNWITFCLQHNCELYFGIEEVSNKIIKSSVFAVNDQMGYVHVLVAEIHLKVIDDGDGTINCRLDSYVPTNNLRNIFAKYHKNKRITPRIYER